MFLRMVALQLRCNLLRRFGGTRQEECRILRSSAAKRLLYHWAADITDRMPVEPAAQREFVSRESVKIPGKVLKHHEIQPLMRQNASLRWLIRRIEDNQPLVPRPYFPSVLRYRLPQFPFQPQEIDKARHLYGLLKFPFYALSADVHPAPAERFRGLKEPVMPNEATVEGNHNIASDCIYHDGGTMGTVDYIYMPSELETGLEDKIV